MPTFRWITAGESHGQGVLAVVEGVPAGLEVPLDEIDAELARRQRGYGRGKRMEIESDRATVLGGLKRGRTLGSPVSLLVGNKDARIDQYRTIRQPRPGHADFAGAMKYATSDCADILERASARETAARVAAGGLARCLLRAVGIEVYGEVRSIGGLPFRTSPGRLDERRAARDASAFRNADQDAEAAAVVLVDRKQKEGDTVGGTFTVEALGVPPGVGSSSQWDQKLDGRLAQALMSIPGIKAVEVGAGVLAGEASGLGFHDSFSPDGGRSSNRAGGIEGGMSNGQPLVLRATMKPIPSVRRPLPSLDLHTGEPKEAAYERSDVCSVPAASVVGEAMVLLVLAEAVVSKAGGDSMPEFVRNWHGYLGQSFREGGRAGPESG